MLLASRDFPPLDATSAPTLIDGAELEAQNIVEAIYTPLGSLPWEPLDGSLLTTYLNDLVDPEEIIAELRRVTLQQDGVIESTVSVTHDARRDQYSLGFVGPSGRRILVTVGG